MTHVSIVLVPAAVREQSTDLVLGSLLCDYVQEDEILRADARQHCMVAQLFSNRNRDFTIVKSRFNLLYSCATMQNNRKSAHNQPHQSHVGVLAANPLL